MSQVLIIAEAGVNHNGSLDLAKKLVDVAADCCSDVVKFQSFIAENLVSKSAKKADYQIKNMGNNESHFDMIKRLELSDESHAAIFNHCKTKNIEFLSTAFDEVSATHLKQKGYIQRVKIPSGEVTNAPFVLKLASTGLPIILSTGMCSLADIERALGVIAFGLLGIKENPSRLGFEQALRSSNGFKLLKKKVTILQCTTEYPAPHSEANLRALETIRSAFGLDVGFSDHTLGISAPIAAAALGATIIEKHFTLDRALPGPDHKASLEPAELKEMVTRIREVEASLGHGRKVQTESEIKNVYIARKSLVAAKAIQVGEAFTPENLTCKRPGHGISPIEYWNYLGRVANRSYVADDLIEP